MNLKINIILTSIVLTAPILSHAHSNSLTPPNQPQNNRYYVCYKARSYEAQDKFSRYYKYHYHGCIITTLPCKYKGGTHNKYFGKFDTYKQTLNAFYRCAYS